MLSSLFGSPSSQGVNSRARRVQQLREKRVKSKGAGGGGGGGALVSTGGSGGGGSSDDGDDALVVTGACTMVIAALIVAAGAGLATLFFSIYQPECVKDLSATTLSSTGAASVVVKQGTTTSAGGKFRRLVTLSDFAPTSSKSSLLKEPHGKFPPQCAPEQFEILKKQLPAGGCELRKDKPYMRTDCSFSVATTCGSVPHWLHHHIVENDLAEGEEEFTAILVGCNNAYDAIDLLRLATRDAESKSYNKKAWSVMFRRTDNPKDKVEERKSECPMQDISVPPGTSPQKAQIYGIEAMPKTFQQLEKTKASLGYGNELDFSHVAIGLDLGEVRVNMEDPIAANAVGIVSWNKACRNIPRDDGRCASVPVDKIDNWIMTKPKLAANPASTIHYMSVTVEGNDYEVLQGSARTLRRVQYLDLGYHWYGDWGTSDRSLKDLMFRLKKKGFACYWAGDSGNMWRITDCWQDHYELRFFANIACVNTNITSAQLLVDRMERMFQETLTKPLLQFGKA